MLIDVHCHLDFKEFDKDLDQVIKRAENNKFKVIISNGTNLERNKKVLEISKKYKIVKPAFGLYPTDAETISEKDLKENLSFIEKNNPIAIGEVGLDLYYGKKLKKQKEVLKILIDLAKKLKIPIIIHSRKAERETIKLLENNKAEKVVLHCFCGNAELTKKAVELGYYFSVPTSITRNKTFKKLVKRVPIEKILTETDAPFLSPYLEKRNEPSFIKETIEKISRIKKTPEKEIEKQIYENYKKIF
jgi:TatD DNase family protein